jgi:hypothetical protein
VAKVNPLRPGEYPLSWKCWSQGWYPFLLMLGAIATHSAKMRSSRGHVIVGGPPSGSDSCTAGGKGQLHLAQRP